MGVGFGLFGQKANRRLQKPCAFIYMTAQDIKKNKKKQNKFDIFYKSIKDNINICSQPQSLNVSDEIRITTYSSESSICLKI